MSGRYFFYCLAGLILLFSNQAIGQVWTYDCPGGEEYSSPDYEVSIIQGNDTLENFVYYSYGEDTIVRYKWNLRPDETRVYDHNGPERHSASIFSFHDSVTVRVKIRSGAQNITLPLTSAKILPSSYNIPCEIKEGNIIEFKLDRPEKVVVFPNYDKAWDIYAQKSIGHIPIQSWKDYYTIEKSRESYHGVNLDSYLTEGYQNPLFIFAHGPEKRVPNPTSSNTLIIYPGDFYNQNSLFLYDTIWFKPGIHDFSRKGSLPWFQTYIKKGQTFYLEGGAYVKARFKEYNTGTGPSSIIGRGIISGINHPWVRSFPEGSQVISIDSVIGVTITDRACFGIYGGNYIGDVAMIGAWHGNTDGPDYTDNCLIENCFLQAHDDNLKINHNTHARHCVIWQGTNAHAIMVKETFRDGMIFANSIVEDIDIIGYFPDTDWNNPWPQISKAAISVVTAMDVEIKNLTFRDIRIEAPYLARIFNIYNLNTNLINPGWFNTTSESYHSMIDGISYSNISVNSPVICYRSLLGAGYENSTKNISFSDITINGIEVTSENIDDFFEIECGMIENLRFNDSIFECEIDTTQQIIKVYGVTIGDCPQTILQTGNTHQLFANIAPADASDSLVTWSSSNPTVVSVDSSGWIRALSQGTSTISVTTNDGGFRNSCEIGVMSTGIAATGVSIVECPSNTLSADTFYQLGVNVFPANAGDHRVSWSSSDTTVAVVDAGGTLKAVSEGNSIITVVTNDGDYTDECIVHVGKTSANRKEKIPHPGGVSLYPNPATDKLFLKFPDSVLEKNVNIYNALGHKLISKTTHASDFVIDISNFQQQQFLIVAVHIEGKALHYKILIRNFN